MSVKTKHFISTILIYVENCTFEQSHGQNYEKMKDIVECRQIHEIMINVKEKLERTVDDDIDDQLYFDTNPK